MSRLPWLEEKKNIEAGVCGPNSKCDVVLVKSLQGVLLLKKTRACIYLSA